MFQILQDPGYNFELLRHLSAARYDGSDIAEVLEISPATVKREWTSAKLLLTRLLMPRS